MEGQCLLDPNSTSHLQRVYLYIPVINKDLEVFRHSCDSHKLSTDNNQTPQQLWMKGILQNINSDHQPIRNLYGEYISDRLDVWTYLTDFQESGTSTSGERFPNSEQLVDMQARLTGCNPEEAFGKCLDYFNEIILL